jgi:phenylacetate-CoA ligase
VTDVNRKTPPFWVYNYASCQLYLSSLHIAEWSVTDYVNALVKYQPKCMIGYTNSIYQIALFMKECNQVFKLKAVITNAEPLYEYQEKIIAEAFECPVVETYGQAELVSFASRFPDGKIYESLEMGVTEIIDINQYEDGEYGRLIATGMLNKAMPLIRYDTNDLISNAKYHEDGSLPEYGKILGRRDDVIILEDGRKIVQIDGIFTSELNILQGQIIQEDYTKFTIKLVPALNWRDENKNIIRNSLIQRLGNVDIKIEICNEIEKTWVGKFRVIKSNVKN